MEIVIWSITIYLFIGIVTGTTTLVTTIKYEKEIEKELGEEVNMSHVNILVVITIFTWPRKAIQFITIVKSKIKHVYELQQEQQSKEG